MINPPIKPSTLLNLTDLFNRKNWGAAEGTATNMGLFQKFCERLRLFTPEEQEFIVELSDNFIKIGLQEYLSKFYESLICLGDSVFDNYEKIFIFPLVEPYILNKSKHIKVPRGKTKSANFLHYMIESDDWTWISKLVPTNSIKDLHKLFNPENSCLILIDDFVGTGRTAVDVCKAYLEETFDKGALLPEKVKIVSIAAQKSGIDFVKSELSVDVISNIIISKGISDTFTGSDLTVKKKYMEKIEEKLKVPPDIFFGYGQSEAMITFLNKTPNNTFPVYWYETKSKVAPFPRYKNFKSNG